MANRRELDAIDRGILNRIAEHPGISILQAIWPFLGERAETVLRQRVRQFEIEKRIRVERTRHEYRCFIANPQEGEGNA